MMKILFDNLGKYSVKMEQDFYEEMGKVKVGFVLHGNNEQKLRIMRRLRSKLIQVFAVIDMSDPVQAMKSFLDAADLTGEICLKAIPAGSREKFGPECYDRLLSKAEDISRERGICMTSETKNF